MKLPQIQIFINNSKARSTQAGFLNVQTNFLGNFFGFGFWVMKWFQLRVILHFWSDFSTNHPLFSRTMLWTIQEMVGTHCIIHFQIIQTEEKQIVEKILKIAENYVKLRIPVFSALARINFQVPTGGGGGRVGLLGKNAPRFFLLASGRELKQNPYVALRSTCFFKKRKRKQRTCWEKFESSGQEF